MNQKNQNRLIFLIGGLTGFILLFFKLIFVIIPPQLIGLAGLPMKAGLLIAHTVLWPICKLSTTNICRGLGFDGGPLEWVEYIGVYGGVIIGYGLLFLALAQLLKFIKSRIQK